ncbi:hypothetical protein OGV25_16230 [Pseudomonas sp. P1B16]|uniref:hypothetical protein n=1 Tax=Pseudomonas sp. P1B16 TaxID=2986074 RepID=UPI002A24C945|nr:hypothetical protein [Pseudomonas sp. P1B16]WPM24870.1 hypothetical protein OGV25_16230 [Pseudomonas sp. P1B16]
MSNGELFDSGEVDKLEPDKVLAHMNEAVVLARWQGTLNEMASIAEHKLKQLLPDKPDEVPTIARAMVYAICETMGGCCRLHPSG